MQLRPSYSSELSGLPPGSRVASSDAGSRPGSRPASTDAYFRGTPALTFNSSSDILTGQGRRQTSSEVMPWAMHHAHWSPHVEHMASPAQPTFGCCVEVCFSRGP